mgnify:CR=1 FL=1
MSRLIRVLGVGAMIALTLYGCASFGGGAAGAGDTAEAPALFAGEEFSNRISVDGFRFALPAGWEYGPSIGQGVLFTFRHGEDVTGAVESLRFPEPVDVNRFLEYYGEHVFQSDDRIETTTLESPELGTVYALYGTVDERSVATAISVTPEEAVLVHLSAGAGVTFTGGDLLRLIAAAAPSSQGAHSAQGGAPYRLGEDRVGFVGTDGTWRWVSDDGDGVVVTHTGDEDLVVSLRRVSDAELRQMTLDYGAHEPQRVAATAPLLRGAVGLPVVRWRNDARMEDAIVEYHRNGDTYLLRISQRHLTGEFVLQDLLATPAVQELLDFQIVFPEQEVSL